MRAAAETHRAEEKRTLMSMTTRKQSQPTDATREERRVVMYATRWCGDCRRAKRVFAALGVPFTEIDIERDEAAEAVVLRLNGGMRSVPTIVFPDGTVLVEPSNAALEAKLTPLAAR
jgi:mycoredoxin